MAADVSRQIKSEPKSGLITRDFLGGCFGIESKELDLDLHVPSGWEKRLDLKSGKVYIQRCNPANSPSEQKNPANQISPNFQDIINPNPQSSSSLSLSMLTSNQNPTLNLLEDTSLDLKLVSNCSPSNYTSVCTLDKVKSALDRAERVSTSSSKRRWVVPTSMGSPTKSSSSMSNSSSLSVKEVNEEEERLSSRSGDRNGLLVATACPGCLLYVLISKSDPKCPKCSSVVQLPMVAKKKPKIDLNMSI